MDPNPPTAPPWRLHINEYRYAHAPAVIEAAARAAWAAAPLANYPDAFDLGAAACGEWLALFVGAPGPECVLLTAGADSALRAVVDTAPARGLAALVTGAPGHPRLEHLARLRPLRLVTYPTGLGTGAADAAAALGYHAPDLRAGALVYMGSPDNWTGALWAPNTVAGFASAYPRSLFLVDEAGVEYAGALDGGDAAAALNARSCAGVALDFANVLVLRTFSRAFGLAALGLSYAVGRPETVGALRAAIYHPAVPPEAAAVAAAALRSLPHYHATAAAARCEASVTATELRGAGWWVQPTPANFNLVYAGPDGAAPALAAALAAEGVLVHDCDALPGLAGFVRVTAGTIADGRAAAAALARRAPPPHPPPQSTPKGTVAAVKAAARRTLRVLAGAGVACWAHGRTLLGVRLRAGLNPTDTSVTLAYDCGGAGGVADDGAGAGGAGGVSPAEAKATAGGVSPADPVAPLAGAFDAAGLELFRFSGRWMVGPPPGDKAVAALVTLVPYRLAGDEYVSDCPGELLYSVADLHPLVFNVFYDVFIPIPARADEVIRREHGIRDLPDAGPPA